MKIQCNVCEAAEAAVLCCADEAALCWTCDEKVHAANKLASKHQRVPLSTSNSQMPNCDICQETVGYFFCLEDRALLCRKCDVAIHTVNTLVSSHQRFLLTGVKVGLEAADLGASSSTGKSYSERVPEGKKSHSLPGRSAPMSATSQFSKVMPVQDAAGAGDFLPPKMPFGGESTQQWQFDNFLGLTDLSQNFCYTDNGSLKGDGGEVEEDCLGRVPQMCTTTAAASGSGVWWGNAKGEMDLCMPNVYGNLSLKRRRQL